MGEYFALCSGCGKRTAVVCPECADVPSTLWQLVEKYKQSALEWKATADDWEARYNALRDNDQEWDKESDGDPLWEYETVVKWPDLAGVPVFRAMDTVIAREMAEQMDIDNPGWREEFEQSDPINVNSTVTTGTVEITKQMLDDIPRMPTLEEAQAALEASAKTEFEVYDHFGWISEDWIDTEGEG